MHMREPLPLDAVLQYPDAISQVSATGAGVFWLATIAAEDGRVTVRHLSGEDVRDLTPEANVRSRVMEYGGGAYSVDGSTLVHCDDRTRRVWLRRAGQAPKPLTPEGSAFVYGGLCLSDADGVVLAVREDHSAAPEPRTEIVALDLASDNADGGRVLVTGADFYAGLQIRAGRFAWYQWNHPDMSWDTASVWTAPIDDPADARVAFARDGVSAQHPVWLGDDVLAWSSDESGFWNWHVEGGRTWSVERDCDTPTWVLTPPVAATVEDRFLASIEFHDGRGVIGLWDTGSGSDGVTYPLPGTASIESIAGHAGMLYVVAQWPDRPATLISINPDGTRRRLAGPPATDKETQVAPPEPYWVDGPAGRVHSWFYRPETANPPLIVLTHGGPTGMTDPSYDPAIQFWVSRGFAVVDVNYSGSTGFGRAYRDRLRGAWGETDVDDVAAVVRSLSADGLVDPARVAITGGSAGGYTTLKSLVSTDLYAAGISRYGIGYLPTLVTDTHKAESRYPHALIAPWPEGRDVYEERSPINHLDRLRAPMLILQGLDDKVVPPSQAHQMADAVRSAGLPVSLVLFEGEGHGFRSMAARRQALEAQVSFLEQVFGMPHSPDVPVLRIENLPASS